MPKPERTSLYRRIITAVQLVTVVFEYNVQGLAHTSTGTGFSTQGAQQRAAAATGGELPLGRRQTYKRGPAWEWMGFDSFWKLLYPLSVPSGKGKVPSDPLSPISPVHWEGGRQQGQGWTRECIWALRDEGGRKRTI